MQGCGVVDGGEGRQGWRGQTGRTHWCQQQPAHQDRVELRLLTYQNMQAARRSTLSITCGYTGQITGPVMHGAIKR
jgi:hypothetical protein